MLSLVIPCYNEEKVVEEFYKQTIIEIRKLKVDYEFIFINDGSSDNTNSKLELLKEVDSKIRIITFSRNFGKEAAIFAGLKESKGEYVVLIDADLQHPPHLLPLMYQKITEEGFDSAATFRKSRNGEPRIRSYFSKKFYRIFNRLIDVDIKDGAQDYRMMTREMTNNLICLGEYHRFTKGLMAWIGFNTFYIGCENTERHDGETSWKFWGLVKYALDGIVAFTTKPLKISAFAGMIITSFAFIYMLKIIYNKIFIGGVIDGYSSLMVAVLFLAGIQLVSIGIVGEYIARIYEQIKGRPIYIKKENNEKNYKKN